jgi:murein L,D-transpeptidase YcbB/YkuD
MTYLVFSPYWHVPPSLAVQDIVPAVQKDPDYLMKKSIKVFRGWGTETQEIDPATIDWPGVDRRSFPFRFRQEPGPLNSLGAVKFMFPNAFNVYLHDTPSKELFQKAERPFSSGCIRIAKPLELAEYLLRGASDWSAESIQAAARKGVEQTVRVPEPIPVHLLYWTSWVDLEGNLQLRNDVYGRDRLLDEALRENPPAVH